MHNAILTVSGMTSILISAVLIRMVLGTETGRTDSQLLCVIAVSALSICASYMLVLTSVLLEIYYAMFMLLASYFVWSSAVDTFFFVACATFVVQLVLSVHFMNMRSVVLWNLVVLSVEIIYAMQNPLQTLGRNIVLYLLIFYALIIFATGGFKQWAISTACQEIYISGLKIEKSASSSLLDLVCDVVVQLDGKLNIKNDSPAFKAMLMKNGATTTEGVPFTSFIVDDQERQNFEVQLRAAGTSSEGKVGTFRTKLSDSLRNHVSSDIFFVAVEMDVNVTHYLLGVRECNDTFVSETGVRERNDTFVTETPECPPRKDRKAARKGTPRISKRSEFKQVATPSQPVVPDTCYCSQLLPTSSNAKFHSMLACFNTWNLKVDRTACCGFHAYVVAAKIMLKEFRDTPCDTGFPSFAPEGMQCQACGRIEADPTDMCVICESTEMEAYRLKPESAPALSL
eukprot:TRINITY_DN10539_c0_g1_i1.p1 TRINITY_DN10539_c0_g1~~TRINITY_DN10539_c0_g1_i1.p1  ORF type:complete len:507 (+),score=65.18 TRINITY_DN10539_c0_g1_i1:155-1522(+)